MIDEVHSRHWAKFATEARLPSADAIDMGRTMAEMLPAAFARTVDGARANGLDHPLLQRMFEVLNARSEHCARILETATP